MDPVGAGFIPASKGCLRCGEKSDEELSEIRFDLT